MSFLKRLFSGGDRKQRVARVPRVKVGALHRVAFRPNGDREVTPLLLSNISTQGMGILRQGASADVAAHFSGVLEINQQNFPLEADVKHRSDAVLGCAFTGAFEAVSRAVEDYFRIEICALKLHKVDEAYLKQDPAGKVMWFTDGKQNELYVVADDKGVANFHLSFLGNYIEGGRDKVLRAGHIVADERHKYPGADMLELTSNVSGEILRLGQALVENVEGLPKDQSDFMRSLLAK